MCPIPTRLTHFVTDTTVWCNKTKNPDESGAYQRLGTPSALSSIDHELTAEPFYGFHPPRTVPWRTTCLVLHNPLS